jgi:hypothetical protein
VVIHPFSVNSLTGVNSDSQWVKRSHTRIVGVPCNRQWGFNPLLANVRKFVERAAFTNGQSQSQRPVGMQNLFEVRQTTIGEHGQSCGSGAEANAICR